MHDVNRLKPPRRSWLNIGALLGCTYASAWLYMALARLVPRLGSAEPSYAHDIFPRIGPMTHESLDAIQRHSHSALGYTVWFLACIAALFAVYAAVLALARRAGNSRAFMAVAAAGAVFFAATLVYTPAMLSSDMYAYAHYGRMLGIQHLDAHGPVTEVRDASDPYSLGGFYEWVPSVYGPLWTVLSAGVVVASKQQLGATILSFRLLEVASMLGSAALIWLILRRMAPARARQGLMLFLWNPLVIAESAMGGHNDMCMMVFALLAVWLHLRGWKALTVVALMVSALIKVITLPLVPLYMLMMLRRGRNWKSGAGFVLRAGLGAVAALAISMILARMSPDGLIVRTASSAQFYDNNYHELLFKGLRRVLGEKADTIDAPMDFKTWWVFTDEPAILHDEPSNKSTDLYRIPLKTKLLVVSDEDSDEWLRVYDPVTHAKGYVNWKHLDLVDEPPGADKDPEVARLSGYPPEDWQTVITANNVVRKVTWVLFIIFGLAAAWKTTDFDRFIVWSTWFFIASQLLVFTKIWPWYAIWPLAFGALKPGSNGARMAVMLSAGMSLLYAFIDYQETPWNVLFVCRSIPTIVIPALLFAVLRLSGAFKRSNYVLAEYPESPEHAGRSDTSAVTA